MSRLALLSALLCMLLVSTGRAALEDYYYNNDEIKHELDSLAALYPDWIKVDSIGHSYELEEPIWSAKISDNVHVEEDEPAFWVNGACHSEEILGINITMAFIRELVALGSIGHPNWGPIIQSMEIHCVPSNNPDGMSIVMSELDATYRKNLHSFHPDGHCQIQPGIGNDSCGVDLNRNYPAWFEHGDGLWAQNSDAEQYDYFRGPYPLSEPECRCIAEQTERERFVAAVAYHSARTSTNHEIIIHPWEWSEGRTCPSADYDMMQTLTRAMGDQISGQNYEYYRNIAGSGRKGNHHNWIYSHYGAVGLLIEVGTQGAEGMQPQDSEFIQFVVDENIDGLNWLCRRIIGYDVAAPGLVVHTRDAVTQNPVSARLRIEEVMHPDVTPWYSTDPLHGAYYRLLKANPYTVKVRKHGYAPRDESVNVGAGLPTQRSWDLTPLPQHNLTLSFIDYDTEEPLTVSRLELKDLVCDTTLVFENLAEFQQQVPEGSYELKAWAEGHATLHRTLVLAADMEMPLALASIEWPEEDLVFSEEFTSLDQFEQLGENCDWVIAENDSMGLHFEDASGRWSLAESDCRLASAASYYLAAPIWRDTTPGSLDFSEFHRCEGARDTIFVEFSEDGGDSWYTVDFWTGQSHQIMERSYPLNAELAESEFRFGFRVKTDAEIQDEGLHLSNIRLNWNGYAVSSIEEPDLVPDQFLLTAAPNPFNPATRVSLHVPATSGAVEARAMLYNLRGQLLREVAGSSGSAGAVVYHIDGSGLSSGSYFLQVTVSQGSRILWQDAARLNLVK